MTVSAGAPAPQPSTAAHAPTGVWVAVITTWVTAGANVLVSLPLTAGVLLLGGPIAAAFEMPLWWLMVLAGEAATVACCLGAALLARGVLRGSKAARWGLIASSSTTAVVCAMTVYYVWTGVVAVAAFVVVTSLCLPSADRWTRMTRSVPDP